MKIHQLKRKASSFQKPVNEKALKIQLAHLLAGEHVHSISELDAGLFNNTYDVSTSHNHYILKVAPTKESDVFFNERFLMQREKTISTRLQSVSPLIPKYIAFFDIDGRSASLQQFIDGRLWHNVISSLSVEENTKLWLQLGAFTKRLHSVKADQFGYPAPVNVFNLWSQFIIDNVNGMADDCRRLNIYSKEIEIYQRHLQLSIPNLDEVQDACLLHGDIWPRNVIIDGRDNNIHIKAVIDGERAYWGDPISDWVLVLYDLPEDFWLGYGENLLQTQDPVRIAIYKGMYFILNILEAIRFQEPVSIPRARLSVINGELESLINMK